jgi:leader peptidase (prepilin peptidase) / N-methyltransferase
MEINPLVVAGVAAVFGLLMGSFATVAAHRIPRRESFLVGRSKCPYCGHVITAAENIPLLSFALQRGRCRHCGARISWRYPATEVVTAALFSFAVLRFGVSFEALVYAGLFWVLVVLAVIDLEHRLLPNRVVYPAFVVGWVALALAAWAEDSPERLADAALGAALFGGLLFLVAFIYPAGMGGGDVKLAFVLGTFLGYAGGIGVTLVGMFLSFLLGGLIGVVVLIATGGDRKYALPFGPFLAGGSVIAMVAGLPLLRAYLAAF